MQTPEAVRRAAGITGTMDAATIEAKLLEATTSSAIKHLMYEEDYSYSYVAHTKNGTLYTIDLLLTFEEAYIVAQGTVITNAVRDKFRPNKKVWGIYAPSPYAAGKLAGALTPGSTPKALLLQWKNTPQPAYPETIIGTGIRFSPMGNINTIFGLAYPIQFNHSKRGDDFHESGYTRAGRRPLFLEE